MGTTPINFLWVLRGVSGSLGGEAVVGVVVALAEADLAGASPDVGEGVFFLEPFIRWDCNLKRKKGGEKMCSHCRKGIISNKQTNKANRKIFQCDLSKSMIVSV